MDEPRDFEQNRSANVWWAILAIGVALTLCYLLSGTLGLLAVYPPARALVLGPPATDTPAPQPRGRPTRTAAPARPEAPTEIVLQAGILAGAPTLHDLLPAWQELSAPGRNNWNLAFAYDQPVSLYTGWCTATEEILEENLRHITFLLQVDFETIRLDEMAWLDQPGNGGVCRSYSGFVQAWPIGAHTVVMTMRLGRSVNDGWNDYPAGDYVDTFNITVTR